MKKRYILILGLIFALAISYVSAAENGTDIIKEQSSDLMAVNQQEIDNISTSGEGEVVSVSSENSSSTDDGQLLGSANDTETLAVPMTNDILNTTVTVTPLASSYYTEPTKKERTFNIGGFKAVLTPYQYKKFYKISGVEDKYFDDEYYDYYDIGDKYAGYSVTSTGLRYTVVVKTNKYIKVKVKIGNAYKIRKTRAKMIVTYGAGQSGVAYRHMIFLTHKYANPGYDYSRVLGSAAKYFGKCKTSPDFTKLNKCSLKKCSTVYKKYAIY